MPGIKHTRVSITLQEKEVGTNLLGLHKGLYYVQRLAQGMMQYV
jgi:hypothetical protein